MISLFREKFRGFSLLKSPESTVNSWFQAYYRVLHSGGPYGSTQMVCMNIYRTAFGENDLGRAQAKALIFVIVIAIVSLTQLYCSKKMEVEM